MPPGLCPSWGAAVLYSSTWTLPQPTLAARGIICRREVAGAVGLWWLMWGHTCMRPSESHGRLARAPSLLGQSIGRWAQQLLGPWGSAAATSPRAWLAARGRSNLAVILSQVKVFCICTIDLETRILWPSCAYSPS